MATGRQSFFYPSSKERTNYARLCRAIVDLSAQVLRDILQREIQPGQINSKVKSCRSLKLNKTQRYKLIGATGQGYSEFDVSLLYALLKKLCPNISPTKGWDYEYPPLPMAITLGDDVQRIQFIRNNAYGHLSSTCIPEHLYQQYWQILKNVLLRIDIELGSTYSSQLLIIETCCMDEEAEIKYVQRLRELEDANNAISSKADLLTLKIKHLTDTSTAERVRSKKGLTKILIEDHRHDQTFYSVRAVEEGLRILSTYGVLIYSGKPGTGKTKNAMEVINKVLDSGESNCVVVLDNPLEWDFFVDKEANTVILLDNCLRRDNIKDLFFNKGKQFWDPIYSCVKEKRLKLMITVDNDILNSFIELTMYCKMFREEHFICLSNGEFQLNDQEIKEIFKLHCIFNDVSIVDETTIPLAKIKIPGLIKYVSFEIIEPFGMGVPQAISLFLSSSKNMQRGQSFFHDPSQALIDEIDKIRASRFEKDVVTYNILLSLLVHGSVDLDKLCEDIASLLKRMDITISVRDKVKRLTDRYIRNIGEPRPRPFREVMKYVLAAWCAPDNREEIMKEIAFERELYKTNKYEIIHHSVSVAIALSLAQSNFDLCMDMCPYWFIENYVKTSYYDVKEGEKVFMLRSERQYESLIRRLMSNLTNLIHKLDDILKDQPEDYDDLHCKIYEFLDHDAFDEPEFIAFYMKVIKKDELYLDIIRKSCGNVDGIFAEACSYDKCKLVEALFADFRDCINTDDCLMNANRGYIKDKNRDILSIEVVGTSTTSTTQWLLDNGIGLQNLVQVLAHAHAEKLNIMLNHPVTQLGHIKHVLDTYGKLYLMDHISASIILKRWPGIDLKYVDKLIYSVLEVKLWESFGGIQALWGGDEKAVEILEKFKADNMEANID